MAKKTYKIDGMHCTNCSLAIELDLEDAGIKASCSYTRQTLEVEYDEKKIQESDIKSLVKKSGYSLT